MSEMPVLLFSDEVSYIYRSEVMREVREFGFKRTLDGDSMVQEDMRDQELPARLQNNFVTFRNADQKTDSTARTPRLRQQQLV